MATTLPQLDTLLNSLNAMEQGSRQQPRVWNPQVQTHLVAQKVPDLFLQNTVSATSAQTTSVVPPSPGSLHTGRAVLSVPAAQQADLFMRNYVRPQDAVKNLNAAQQNAQTVHQKLAAATTLASTTARHCRVYPPLLVRYAGPDDAYIPVNLMAGAELQTTRGLPDLILNFHADTQAITVTTCRIEPTKWPEYELAMQVLYSLTVPEAERTLNVREFTQLYDQVRYNLLRALALTAKKT